MEPDKVPEKAFKISAPPKNPPYGGFFRFGVLLDSGGVPAILKVEFGIKVSSIKGSSLMSRTTAPLSDAACRSAKPTDRAYKLFDGDGLYL